MNKTVDSVEAQYGKNMIELRVRFWVNDIAKERGKIIQKHCWDSGMVHITSNKSHAIKAGQLPFSSLMQLNAVIEKLIIDNKIKLHHCRKSTKYYK